MISARSSFRLYVASMVPFALIVVNWRHTLLAWDEPISGACVQVAVWLLPWVALAGVLHQPRPDRQLLGILSLLPMLLFSLIAIPWSIRDVETVVKYGKDLEFEPIGRIDVADGSQLVTFLSNCGLACGPVVVLRHERAIVGPLKIVRIVTGHDGEMLRVRLTDDRHVTVEGETFVLRQFVLF
jgi:hypothetical protein